MDEVSYNLTLNKILHSTMRRELGLFLGEISGKYLNSANRSYLIKTQGFKP